MLTTRKGDLLCPADSVAGGMYFALATPSDAFLSSQVTGICGDPSAMLTSLPQSLEIGNKCRLDFLERVENLNSRYWYMAETVFVDNSANATGGAIFTTRGQFRCFLGVRG